MIRAKTDTARVFKELRFGSRREDVRV